MLRTYLRDGTRIKLGPVGQQPASVDPTCPLVWLDLFNTSVEQEDKKVTKEAKARTKVRGGPHRPGYVPIK